MNSGEGSWLRITSSGLSGHEVNGTRDADHLMHARGGKRQPAGCRGIQAAQLYLAAKLLAAFRAAPEPADAHFHLNPFFEGPPPCEESTPLVSPAAPATARISEALPRSTEHLADSLAD